MKKILSVFMTLSLSITSFPTWATLPTIEEHLEALCSPERERLRKQDPYTYYYVQPLPKEYMGRVLREWIDILKRSCSDITPHETQCQICKGQPRLPLLVMASLAGEVKGFLEKGVTLYSLNIFVLRIAMLLSLYPEIDDERFLGAVNFGQSFLLSHFPQLRPMNIVERRDFLKRVAAFTGVKIRESANHDTWVGVDAPQKVYEGLSLFKMGAFTAEMPVPFPFFQALSARDLNLLTIHRVGPLGVILEHETDVHGQVALNSLDFFVHDLLHLDNLNQMRDIDFSMLFGELERHDRDHSSVIFIRDPSWACLPLTPVTISSVFLNEVIFSMLSHEVIVPHPTNSQLQKLLTCMMHFCSDLPPFVNSFKDFLISTGILERTDVVSWADLVESGDHFKAMQRLMRHFFTEFQVNLVKVGFLRRVSRLWEQFKPTPPVVPRPLPKAPESKNPKAAQSEVSNPMEAAIQQATVVEVALVYAERAYFKVSPTSPMERPLNDLHDLPRCFTPNMTLIVPPGGIGDLAAGENSDDGDDGAGSVYAAPRGSPALDGERRLAGSGGDGGHGPEGASAISANITTLPQQGRVARLQQELLPEMHFVADAFSKSHQRKE